MTARHGAGSGFEVIGPSIREPAFLQAIDTCRAPMVDGCEGRKSVEIIRAIYRSAKIGEAVELPFDDRTE
jgi:UDP-N-acetyl-2-amino-2-deoxyglucuronate dehydrogenase